MGGDGPVPGPDRAPADVAGRPRLRRQAGGRDRLGRHRGDADPGHGARLRAHHDAAALAHVLLRAGATSTSSPTRCASSTSPRSGPTRSCAARSSSSRGRSPSCCVDHPELVREELLEGDPRPILGPDFDIDTHFNPRYRPWQQRIAFVPDGDLFEGIKSGKASVVTDEIECFTETGHPAALGRPPRGRHHHHRHRLRPQRARRHRLHDRRASRSTSRDTVTYRGMMFTGIPNMVWVFGYFRASWTLRVDLIGDFVCRLLEHMDELGATVVTPGAATGGRRHAAAAVGRARELQPRLPPAGPPPAPQAGRPRSLAPHPGLLDGEGRAAGRRPRRRRPPLPPEPAEARPHRRRRWLLVGVGVVVALGAAAAWLLFGGDEPRPVTVDEARERSRRLDGEHGAGGGVRPASGRRVPVRR